MSDIVIQARGISKKYEIGTKKSGSFRDTFSHLFSKKQKAGSESLFWALKDVSFDVKKGEAVGIIGRNGAGKSTMLKILSRITEPSEGRIEINGRVASLLEVGTGFHAELTGRENIYLNGTILGMTREEVKRKFDEIVEFSGIEKFIDTPVKRYSSGMYVRLAFSVAAHLEPEILVIDEVLAVGDLEFQKKCLGKMEDVSKTGRTVLFVSHDMAAVNSLCSSCILLHHGQVKNIGPTHEIIEQYQELATSNSSSTGALPNNRQGDGSIRVTGIEFISEQGYKSNYFNIGEDLKIALKYACKQVCTNVVFRIQFYSLQTNHLLFTCNNYHSFKPYPQLDNNGVVECVIPKLPLNKGDYYISVTCLNNFKLADEFPDAFTFSVNKGDFFGTGLLPHPSKGMLVNHSWS